ncbi:phosphopantetheine-binding protein [Chitinibacter sp. FCG-7]|uniref:Phosphopantetheine-binding protein n=1 Tax=Chitinibacter mangrovi TaxID=3153927 RepID=A0AAU7FCC4_9NEIS
MGLDAVELIVMVEQEFAIRIADRDAARILTVGELCDHVVLCCMQSHGLAAPSATNIEQRISRILVQQLHIHPEQIHRAARFVDDLGLD